MESPENLVLLLRCSSLPSAVVSSECCIVRDHEQRGAVARSVSGCPMAVSRCSADTSDVSAMDPVRSQCLVPMAAGLLLQLGIVKSCTTALCSRADEA